MKANHEDDTIRVEQMQITKVCPKMTDIKVTGWVIDLDIIDKIKLVKIIVE